VLRDSAPLSYQEIAGLRVPVRSRYVVNGAGKRAARFSSPQAATSGITI